MRLPLDILDDNELDNLRTLMDSRGWSSLMKTLGATEDVLKEKLVPEQDTRTCDRMRGAIGLCRDLGSLSESARSEYETRKKDVAPETPAQ